MSRITKFLLATVLALAGAALFVFLRPESPRRANGGSVAEATSLDAGDTGKRPTSYRELVPRSTRPTNPALPGQTLPEPSPTLVALLQSRQPKESEVLLAYKQDSCFCRTKDCIIDVEDRYRDTFARLKHEPDHAVVDQLTKEIVACKDRALSEGKPKLTEEEMVRRRELEMTAAIPPAPPEEPAPSNDEPEQP
jgi:hypothetical protein